MGKIIPYQKQFIDEDDIEAVVDILKKDFITRGPKTREFEEKIAQYVGAKYAVVVSNGTAGLHLACLAVGLGEGDELITTPLTFLASANCALYCGAKVVFSDVDEQGLLDVEGVKEKVNQKTKIVVPVHLGGMPCDMRKLRESFGGVIVEDACHALGSRFDGESIGSCKYSDMAVFSFHPIKHITTGEGGMITTNSKKLYEKLLKLRNHGINSEGGQGNEPWATPMDELGYNYRVTDFQCALGISQLKKLEKFLIGVRAASERYNAAFENDPNVKINKEKPGQFNAHHLYQIFLRDGEIRFRLYNYLRENGVYVQIHYQPVYSQPYYKSLGYEGGCKKAEDFYSRTLSLPIYSQMSVEDQDFVIEKIKEFFRHGI